MKIIEFILTGKNLTQQGDLSEFIDVMAATPTTDPNPIIRIIIPVPSKILSAHFNQAGQLMLSVCTGADSRSDERMFVVLQSGQQPPERTMIRSHSQRVSATHVASAQRGTNGAMFHVFEMVPC
jgi:hypothetical protein